MTIENFLAWKRKFDDDKARERAIIAEKVIGIYRNFVIKTYSLWLR